VITDADSPYTQLATDEWLQVDASAGAVTINLLPVADADGCALVVEALDITNTITLDADDTEEINGSTTKTIGTAGRRVLLQCNGTEWTAHYSDRLP
jgi:hypothetical protein